MFARILITILVSVSILAAGGRIAADEQKPIGGFLHGSWEISGTIKGEQANGTMQVRPVAGGAANLLEWMIRSGDEVAQGAALAGIDQETGEVVETGYGDDLMTSWVNRYEENLGDKIGKTTGRRTGVVDGEPFDGKIVVNRTSRDRFEYQILVDGKKKLDLVFERRAPVNDKLARSWWNYLKGSWDYEIRTPEPINGTMTWTQQIDGRALLGRAEEDAPIGIELSGWDSRSKRWVATGYGVDGNHWTMEFDTVTDSTFSGIHSGTLRDGTEYRGRMEVTRASPDKLRWESEVTTSDGDVLKMSANFERKK